MMIANVSLTLDLRLASCILHLSNSDKENEYLSVVVQLLEGIERMMIMMTR